MLISFEGKKNVDQYMGNLMNVEKINIILLLPSRYRLFVFWCHFSRIFLNLIPLSLLILYVATFVIDFCDNVNVIQLKFVFGIDFQAHAFGNVKMML